jgi:hypothetical protein
MPIERPFGIDIATACSMLTDPPQAVYALMISCYLEITDACKQPVSIPHQGHTMNAYNVKTESFELGILATLSKLPPFQSLEHILG